MPSGVQQVPHRTQVPARATPPRQAPGKPPGTEQVWPAAQLVAWLASQKGASAGAAGGGVQERHRPAAHGVPPQSGSETQEACAATTALSSTAYSVPTSATWSARTTAVARAGG